MHTHTHIHEGKEKTTRERERERGNGTERKREWRQLNSSMVVLVSRLTRISTLDRLQFKEPRGDSWQTAVAALIHILSCHLTCSLFRMLLARISRNHNCIPVIPRRQGVLSSLSLPLSFFAVLSTILRVILTHRGIILIIAACLVSCLIFLSFSLRFLLSFFCQFFLSPCPCPFAD